MTVGDAILVLVDKLLAEKEKATRLELEQEQRKQDEQSSKD